MKTQVIHLDPHDDLISIRDRMAWAKTPRILLVWPKRGRVDVRPLDLALLHRHAESLGAELGLVTRDAEIRQTARRMNLPIFKTTSDAQRKSWPERQAHPQRRFPKVDLRALRATLPAPELFNFSSQTIPRVAVFALGVLAVLIVALVFIPSAEVRVNPPARPQSLTISVSAEKDASQVQISGVIPARETVLTLEATESKTASGKSVLPDKLAAGTVRFTNLTTASVPVPAKTVLLTRSNAPVRFETVKQAEIPAGKGQFADVNIRAITPGTAGNLPAESLTVFEGPLGLSLSVTNLKTLTGGTDISKPVPTDADRQALRQRLLANLKEQAKAKIQAQLRRGDVFFPATFTLAKVSDEIYDPALNQPGEKVTLTLKAEFRADYASADDLEKLAQLALDASLPPGEEPVAKTLSLESASALFGGAEGITRWQVRAERQVRAKVDSAQVISIVQGKTARRAGSLIQQMFGLEAPPQISIRPFFWPWLPSLPFRITVTN